MTRRRAAVDVPPAYRCIFSYYGGKSKLAHLYPPPQFPRIVEPFAGAASYSLRHWEKEVWLYDIDPTVASAWEFLLSPGAEDAVREIPDEVRVGDNVDSLLSWAPRGLLAIARAEANRGTQGAKGVHRRVTELGAQAWPRLKPRLMYWIPRVRHWRFFRSSWTAAPDLEATWFVDPPYSTRAGSRYRQCELDFRALGKWCLSRRGQVIACEDARATWLPFRPLTGRRGVRSRYQVSEAVEAVWARPWSPLFLSWEPSCGEGPGAAEGRPP